jgi:putative tricarboxylic transport membrane protein
MKQSQTLVGLGTLGLGIVLLLGAAQISSEAGYGGVGPNFLPWVVGLGLLLCGVLLVWEASTTGGFREMEAPTGADRGDWVGFGWMSAGILANALLITRIGFVLSCTLCFVLAVRGLKQSQGCHDQGLRSGLIDTAIGMAIAGPVYWMFTKLLAINLPGLTTTGWL